MMQRVHCDQMCQLQRRAQRIARISTLLLLGAGLAILWKTQVRPLLMNAQAPTLQLQIIDEMREDLLPDRQVHAQKEPIKKLTVQESDFKIDEPPPVPEPKERSIQPEVMPTPPPPEAQKTEVRAKPLPQRVTPKVVKRETKASENVNDAAVRGMLAQQGGLVATSGNGTQITANVSGSSQVQSERKNEIVMQLVALVERYKRYPKSARRASQEDLLYLHFSIDSSGTVIHASLAEPSRFVALTGATEEIAKKILGTQLQSKGPPINVTVPIQYKLN